MSKLKNDFTENPVKKETVVIQNGIKEWHRTVLLLLIIAAAIGYILWQRQSVETNFIDSLR